MFVDSRLFASVRLEMCGYLTYSSVLANPEVTTLIALVTSSASPARNLGTS